MAGAGWRTFTAGQVLSAAQVQNYLQDQSVQVYASAAARSSALGTAVSEGMVSYRTDDKTVELYKNGSWTPITDNIYTTLASRGSVVSVEGQTSYLIATDTLDTANQHDLYNGSGWEPVRGYNTVGKNLFNNGGFDIWQRGTTISSSSGGTYAYVADRWKSGMAGILTGWTVSQISPGSTLPQFPYGIRLQRNNGVLAVNSNTFSLYQTIETYQCLPLVGKQITFSMYARAGANYSATSNALRMGISVGYGTDSSQAFGSPDLLNNVTLTTSWQKFSYTVTVPTTISGQPTTQLSPYVSWNPTGTAGAADYVEIAAMQLEGGSLATPFVRAGGSVQNELALCQYYYRRIGGNASNSNASLGFGMALSTTQAKFIIPNQKMRITPSVSFYNASGFRISDTVTATATTAMSADTTSFGYDNSVQVTGTVASGLTQYRPYMLIPASATDSYIELSADIS